MRARINDKFRQHLITNLYDTLGSKEVWLILSNEPGKNFSSNVDIRGKHTTITNANILYSTKILETHLRKALKKAPGVTKPNETNVQERQVGGIDYYVSNITELNIGSGFIDDMWNAIYGEVPITEKHDEFADPQKTYNTISIVIANESSGKPVINNELIIIEQTYINETTLPYDNLQTMKVLIQF